MLVFLDHDPLMIKVLHVKDKSLVVIISSIMLYIPRIANYSEILTEKEVDFVVIFFVWGEGGV